MKILLALGVGPRAAALARAIETLGWAVVDDPAGADAVQLVGAGGIDAALVDHDGREVGPLLERMRAAAPDLALMAVGSAPSLAMMERLFGAGADDVLAHPAQPREVLLRARAIARRRHGHARDLIRFGALAVQPGSHAEAAGARLALSRSEFAILERLALRAGRAVSRNDLMSALYDGAEPPHEKVIDVFVSRARKVLAGAGLPADLVETVSGSGWRLPPPFDDPADRQRPGDTSTKIIAAARARRLAAGLFT